MKRMTTLMSTIVTALLLVIGAASSIQAQTFEGYACNPTTCLQIASGAGFFSGGISIEGTWTYLGREYLKTASAGISSLKFTRMHGERDH